MEYISFLHKVGGVIKEYDGLIALFIAVGGAKLLKSAFIYPDIQVVKTVRTFQGIDCYRLLIKNKGKETAKNVQCDLTKPFDGKKEREGFIPISLEWTHLDTYKRDILPEQSVYLNLVEHFGPTNLHSAAGSAIFTTYPKTNVSKLSEIKPETRRVQLTILQKSRRPMIIELEVKFDGSELFDIRVKNGRWTWDEKNYS